MHQVFEELQTLTKIGQLTGHFRSIRLGQVGCRTVWVSPPKVLLNYWCIEIATFQGSSKGHGADPVREPSKFLHLHPELRIDVGAEVLVAEPAVACLVPWRARP